MNRSLCRVSRLLAVLVLFIGAGYWYVLPSALFAQTDGRQATNAILYILDGVGVSGLQLAREVLCGPEGRLEIDLLPVSGRVIIRARNAMAPDSAAMASALATGRMTDLYHLSALADGTPVPTLWQKARDLGFKTGLVSNTRLTHATPAAFAAHSTRRRDEENIARQILASRFDVLLSGGFKIFRDAFGLEEPKCLQTAEGGPRRSNPADPLYAMAEDAGYHLVMTRGELAKALRRPVRLLGLFSELSMSYSFEPKVRDEPTLEEMTQAALLHLTSTPGRFVLMVESGLTDPALHQHDAAEFVEQMRHTEVTLRLLRDWISRHPDTVLIVVSDHATGGLAVSEHFDVERFNALGTSSIALANEFAHQPDNLGAALRSRMPSISFTDEEIAAVTVYHEESKYFGTAIGSLIFPKLGLLFFAFEDQKAMTATYGHSGEDVFLHAEGPGAGLFTGTFGAYEVPKKLGQLLGIPFP